MITKNLLPVLAVPGLLLAVSCGVKTESDSNDSAQLVALGEVIPVEPQLFASSDNMLVCEDVNPAQQSADVSPECSTPSADLDMGEDASVAEGQSALITIQYTLKCDEKTAGDLSNIAIKTDSQLRRLQYNVENRVISIFDETTPAVSLVTLNEGGDIFSGDPQDTGCWFFSFEKLETKYFGAATGE